MAWDQGSEGWDQGSKAGNRDQKKLRDQFLVTFKIFDTRFFDLTRIKKIPFFTKIASKPIELEFHLHTFQFRQ